MHTTRKRQENTVGWRSARVQVVRFFDSLIFTLQRPLPDLETIILNNRTVILYGLIGGSAALIDFILFIYLYQQLGIASTVSTSLSILLSTLYGFTMNTVFNFRTFDRLAVRFLSYLSVSVVAILASSLSLLLFTDLLGFNAGFVKALSLPLIFLLQYYLNRRYSFSLSKG